MHELNNIMENKGPGTTIAQAIGMYVDEHGYDFGIIMCKRYMSKSSEELKESFKERDLEFTWDKDVDTMACIRYEK